ncbi:LOW QUALITY PROTEIN: hypothetical protein OPAG_06238, partial [Rhodococcus opacus PD630]
SAETSIVSATTMRRQRSEHHLRSICLVNSGRSHGIPAPAPVHTTSGYSDVRRPLMEVVWRLRAGSVSRR